MNAKPVRILLAEEDLAEAGRIHRILAEAGSFQTTHVRHFEDILKHLEMIDVLLLSLSLPGALQLGGIPGLRAAAPDLPIIVAGQLHEAPIAAQAILEGAQDYVVKGEAAAPLLERIIRHSMERTRLLRALRENEDRYRDLVENSEDLICTHDLEGNVLSANPAATRLLGYGRDGWVGKNMRDALAPEMRGLFDLYLQEIRTYGSAKGLMLVETLEGERRIWEYNNTLRSEGVAEPFVRGMAHDVTEFKRVERSLRRQARLLDLAHEAILVLNENGVVTFWNQGAEMLYGIPKEAAMDRISWDLLRTQFPSPLGEILTTVEREGHWEGELTRARADGKQIVVSSRWALSRDRSDLPVQILEIDCDITERKRAEEGVRRSEERFQLISRATNDVMWDWNLLSNETWWSENVQTVFGYSPDDPDLSTGLWGEKIHPEDRERILREIDRDIAEKKLYSTREFRFLRADGSYVTVLDRCCLLLDETGRAVRMIGTTMDITAQKLAKQQLEESFSLLRATLDSTADGILVVDHNGKIVSYNQRFAQMWAIPESVVTTRDDNQAITFVLEQLKYPEEFLRKIRELYADPDGESFDVLEFKDGKIFERYSQPQRIGQKSVGRVWSFRDVTEREQALQALRSSEGKYRTLFEESKDVVFISTPEGRLLDINPAGIELFGYSSKDELKQVDVRSLFLDPADRTRFEQEISRQGYVKDFELTLRKKSGQRLDVLETSTAVRDEKGAVIAYRGMIRDVTEMKRLQQQLAQFQRIETIGRLAGGVAHDFNNILMAISMTCELVLMKMDPSDSKVQDLQQILKAAERGASLAHNMLAFSRKQILSPEVLDLNLVLGGMEIMLRRMIGEDIELVMDFGSALGRVHADPAQIEQVLMNLVVNARDAMPGGGKLSIKTSNIVLDDDFARHHAGAVPGRYVMIAVSDTGCGMDPATAARVFEPFYTTKEAGKGTGLGLSTVYGIVKQSGGYILVESEVGGGSNFRIFLPLTDRHEEKAAVFPAAAAVPSPTALTVLLVDDNEDVLKAMTQMLQIRGYSVLAAPGGIRALEILRTHQGPIHLLVTDVVMPKMNGLELATRVMTERSGIKVLFISGFAEKELLLKEKIPPGAAFLAKPVSMEAIIEKVRQLIQA